MSRFLIPSRRSANLALYGTISLCTATSLLQFSTDNSLRQAAQSRDKKTFDQAVQAKKRMLDHCTCSLRNLTEGRVYTLITSSWNHGSLMHFLGNMLGLWSFGRTIAYQFGARAFLGLFYGGALTGNLACLGLDSGRFSSPFASSSSSSASSSSSLTTTKPLPSQKQAQDRNYIGASGGVCAVSCATACLNPWGMMIVGIAFIPVPIPNILFPVGFAAFSAYAEENRLQQNVAHLGHLGGLAYGFVWFLARFRGMPV